MKEVTKPQKPSIDWIEAHHEIVSGITGLLDDYEDNYFKKVYENRGIGGIWEVAEDLTDEFQKINENRT